MESNIQVSTAAQAVSFSGTRGSTLANARHIPHGGFVLLELVVRDGSEHATVDVYMSPQEARDLIERLENHVAEVEDDVPPAITRAANEVVDAIEERAQS